MNQFSDEFNVITGLVNLCLLWDKIDRGPPPPGRRETAIDWNGPPHLQAAPRSDDGIGAHCGAMMVHTRYCKSLQNVFNGKRSPLRSDFVPDLPRLITN